MHFKKIKMNLEGIISVTGKSGLFKVISQGKNAVIVENLTDKKRIPLTARQQANTLDEIGVYTYDDTKPLSEIFDDIAKGNGPKVSILAIGYAGWGAGQLEYEIKQNSWMTLPVKSSFIFDEQISDKWNDAYKMMGFDPISLSQFSGNA